MAALFEGIDKTVATGAAIVALGITVTGYFHDQRDQRAKRYEAFRTAVASEDKAWRGLYDDYLGTFTGDFQSNLELRAKKRAALTILAQRDVAAFEEFEVPDELKSSARQRLQTVQEALWSALGDEKAGTTAEAAANQQIIFDSVVAKATATPPPATATGTATVPAVTLPTVGTVLTRGRNAGWDVDVFWCTMDAPPEGQAHDVAAGNYRTAKVIAETFADYAAADRVVAPGIALGRVRLRPVTVKQQRDLGIIGPLVLRDDSSGELEAATALLRLVNGSPGTGSNFAPGRSRTRSPWYLSVFACPLSAN